MSLVSRSVLGAPSLVRPRRAAWRATTLGALALCCALAAGACDSPAQKPGLDGGTGGAGAAGGAGGAPARLAVLSSDFTAASVALLAEDAIKDDCLRSGTKGANMEQALSGDATLPSQPQHNGDLAVIDRKSAVITYVTVPECTPRLQFSVSTGGFKSNPHDVISVSAEKAYVTRYEKNAAPTAAADDFDDGDDLVIVDAMTGVITGSILLSGELAAGVDPTVQARPDRGVLADGKVYVVLGSLSGDFATAGPGRVVVIDPTTDKVTGAIDLPAQTGCSAIEYHQTAKKLYVSCGGSFADGAEQAKKSALVEIDISGATPTVARVIKAVDLDGQPINFSYAAVLGDTAFVGTLGAFPNTTAGTPGTSDALFGASLEGGTPVKLKEGGAYSLGRALVDAAGKRVFLPDGDFMTPRVHVFDASTSPATLARSFEANPAGHLPPREVAFY